MGPFGSGDCGGGVQTKETTVVARPGIVPDSHPSSQAGRLPGYLHDGSSRSWLCTEGEQQAACWQEKVWLSADGRVMIGTTCLNPDDR